MPGGRGLKRDIEQARTRSKSDDLPYRGNPVAVPDMGPDSLDEHGAPRASNVGSEPGLSQRRIRELAKQYQDRVAHSHYQETGDTRTTECDAWLRAIVREEVDRKSVV